MSFRRVDGLISIGMLLVAGCAADDSSATPVGVSGKGGAAGDAALQDVGAKDSFVQDGPVKDAPLEKGPSEASLPESHAPDAPEDHDASFIDAVQDVAQDPGQDAEQDVNQEPAVCQPVQAAAAPDPWNTRLASAGFGGIVTASSGGNTDVFLQSPAPNPDYIRIGARLNWGGSVVFFGLSANPQSNVVDANDTGRELQIALYDPSRQMQGCAWNASCQSSPTTCPNSISYLGWDPVQGGDRCGHGSPSTHSQAGDALRVIAHPLQWNPDWDRPDCNQTACGASGVPVAVTYAIDFRFVSTHVVEVATEIQSQETIDHPSTGQEFPTLYVANGNNGPDLPLLLDAAGNLVGLNTPGNDGFFYDNFVSPGPWVSWQNSTQDYGIALAMDQGIVDWQGWRGNGQSAPYFHNVRSLLAFGLKAGGKVRGISYLALGGFGTVQSQLASALGARPPFGLLDTPAAGGSATVSPGQSIPISGWVLDTSHIDQVQIELDGVHSLDLPVNAQRPDVCEVYPAYAGCPAVGFSGSIPTDGWDSCPHLVRVTAKDSEGNSSSLGESVVTVTAP